MTYSAEVLTDSPLAYWKLDETSGTTAADSSGNARDATYAGSPTVGDTSLLGDGSGHSMGVAANTGQRAAIASASWMNVSAFTLETLVRFSTLEDTTNGDAIVSRYTASDTFPLLLWRNTAGKPALQVVVGGTRWNLASATSFSVNTIYHIVATYDGTTIRLYVNGSQVASQAATGAVGWSSSALEIGRYSLTDATTPDAKIDEVALYDHDIGSTRVANHSTAAFAVGNITVTGEAFTSTVTMRDGSALTAIQVAGEVFVSAATMLDGSVVGTTIAGEAFTSVVTMLDGAISGVPVTVTGERFVVTVAMLDGAMVTATDSSNAFDGLDFGFAATVTVTHPVAALPASLVPAARVDKAVPYPVPVMVDGRPT